MTDDFEQLRELSEQLAFEPTALAETIVRYQITDGPDLLAFRASKGRQDLAGILNECDELFALHGEDIPAEIARRYRSKALPALARSLVQSVVRGDPISPELTASAKLYRLAYCLGFRERQSSSFIPLVLQTNWAVGERAFVERVLGEDIVDEHTEWMLRTDLLLDDVLAGRAERSRWLASFNELFAGIGAAPVALDGEGPTAFDQLSVAPSFLTPVTDGPLVSVVMSVWSPGPSLRTAVDSIMGQTWRNLELLMVDDCSPAEYQDLIESVAASDERIRLLRMPANGGTYRIRNEAMRQSRGELVTFQDSDDFAHPERIARQVAMLAGHPELVAHLCSAVRVTDEIALSKVGYRSTRVSLPSLMFRKDVVRERLGDFDPVRKSADREYVERIRVVFGAEAVHESTEPLTIYQLTPGSLSRDEFSFRWQAPARVRYREELDRWHEQIAAGVSSPYLDAEGPRRFPAPAALLQRGTPATIECDVLHVSDWRELVVRHRDAIERSRVLAASGLEVHLLQAEHLRDASRTRRLPWPDVTALRDENAVGWALWDEPRHARLTIVEAPDLLTSIRPPSSSAVTTDRLVVIASSVPRLSDGTMSYRPAVVERHGRELFGADVEWLPATPDVAVALRAEGVTGSVLPPRILGSAHASTRSRPSAPLVVGTWGLGLAPYERLEAEELLALLPVDPGRVRVLDDIGAVGSILPDGAPAGWQVDSAWEPDAFLTSIDVCVVPPLRMRGPGVAWTVTDALGHGCLVVVEPSLGQIYGGAVLTAESDELPSLLRRLDADPEWVSEQRSRGDQFVAAHLGADDFVSFVHRLFDTDR